MLIEKSLMDALREFIKGKPVTVLWQGEDGGMQVSMLSELLDQEENHYLVNVPVMENPEFPKVEEDALPRKEEKSCPPPVRAGEASGFSGRKNKAGTDPRIAGSGTESCRDRKENRN
ncbi:hypothetical protein [Dorea phocaeensis]|uniref:hypothetical protein n=1 Tax=Dorea phocaeensis TaxID=2040291 RepID=UPI000C793E5A|nr:hypothetical protein [Dorea phocaeensis]